MYMMLGKQKKTCKMKNDFDRFIRLLAICAIYGIFDFQIFKRKKNWNHLCSITKILKIFMSSLELSLLVIMSIILRLCAFVTR